MLKKEKIYVSLEGKEQAEIYRKVLEAMGEPISACYWAKNNNVLVTESNKCWVTTDTNYSVGKDNTKDKTKITFGELIDLLQRKPRITTEDGVDCYDGDTIVSVNVKDLYVSNNCFVIDRNDVFTSEKFKYFSSESKALEWIEAQKPKLPIVNETKKEVVTEIEIEFNEESSVLITKDNIKFSGKDFSLTQLEVMDIFSKFNLVQNA